MLVIDREQFQHFADRQREKFLSDLKRFLVGQFPQHAQAMGAAALDALVKLSYSRAGALGFEAEREHKVFAVYCVLFGAYFDEDPQYPWASDRLGRSGLNPDQRIDLFRSRAEQAILQIEESARRTHTLKALAAMNPTTLTFWLVDVNTPLIDWYAALFPAHASWMRPPDFSALSQRAQALASDSGLIAPAGEKLIIAAMGMLGAGFAQDPQFHALRAALTRPLPPDQKTVAFAEAGRSLAREWLARSEGDA